MIVFVYGTLLRGEGNHRLLARATFLGEARTKPEYRLYDLGGFPAITTDGAQSVIGEVFEVDGPTLRDLDRLEGHPYLYVRTEVELADGTRASLYVWNSTRPWRYNDAPIIPSGAWRCRKKTA